MTAQELIATNNSANTKSLFRAARKVPAEKLEWRPLDNGRSVLDICQECALSATWPVTLFASDKPFQLTPEIMEQFKTAKAALKTLDECEAAAEANVAKLNELVLSFPDEKMGESIPMPMFPGGQMPVTEALQLYNWNVSYHTGQVNYIQTLYGDASM